MTSSAQIRGLYTDSSLESAPVRSPSSQLFSLRMRPRLRFVVVGAPSTVNCSPFPACLLRCFAPFCAELLSLCARGIDALRNVSLDQMVNSLNSVMHRIDGFLQIKKSVTNVSCTRLDNIQIHRYFNDSCRVAESLWSQR